MRNLLGLFFVILFSSNLFSQIQTCPQNANHPGYQTLIQVIGSDTIVREYILHIPADYDENVGTSLVVNMHGFGDCAADFEEGVGEYFGFNELADEKNFIVAYPQGAYRPEKEDNYWEPGDNGTDNIYENDVFFINELVAEISTQYNVIQERVFACGYSNGGMMAYSLACNSSDVFAAIGIMSGTMLEEECALESPIPIIIFHGIGDEVLPYYGNDWYPSVDQVVNYWLDLNNLPSEPNVSNELKNGDVIMDQYIGAQNACLELFTIIEEFDKPGDHVWFSEEISNKSPSKIMWLFFDAPCSLGTSNNNLSLEASVTISPNPFKDRLRIESTSKVQETINIYDIQGRLMIADLLEKSPKMVNTHHLASGIYFIHLNGEFRKLIKLD